MHSIHYIYFYAVKHNEETSYVVIKTGGWVQVAILAIEDENVSKHYAF